MQKQKKSGHPNYCHKTQITTNHNINHKRLEATLAGGTQLLVVAYSGCSLHVSILDLMRRVRVLGDCIHT